MNFNMTLFQDFRSDQVDRVSVLRINWIFTLRWLLSEQSSSDPDCWVGVTSRWQNSDVGDRHNSPLTSVTKIDVALIMISSRLKFYSKNVRNISGTQILEIRLSNNRKWLYIVKLALYIIEYLGYILSLIFNYIFNKSPILGNPRLVSKYFQIQRTSGL